MIIGSSVSELERHQTGSATHTVMFCTSLPCTIEVENALEADRAIETDVPAFATRSALLVVRSIILCQYENGKPNR